MTRTILLFCLFAACGDPLPVPSELVFVAVEGDGAIAVLDARDGSLVRSLSLAHGDGGYAVHNVQAADDGMVWATARPSGAGHDHVAAAGAEGDALFGVAVDDLALTDRIELGVDLHPAHVVAAAGVAHVTATDADAVLVVDLVAGRVARSIPLAAGTGPHGARRTRDGRVLAVAGMGAGSLELVDADSGAVESVALPGRAVQVAIAPDDRAVFATIFDTCQVARLDLATRTLTLFDLPAGCAGPLQLYPTPDGRRLWVADQGMLEGAPTGDTVIELDAVTGAVERVVEVDPGPHGVVVTRDGRTVWITTLVRGTVQAIDVATGAVTITTAVGAEPNGITYRDALGPLP